MRIIRSYVTFTWLDNKYEIRYKSQKQKALLEAVEQLITKSVIESNVHESKVDKLILALGGEKHNAIRKRKVPKELADKWLV